METGGGTRKYRGGKVREAGKGRMGSGIPRGVGTKEKIREGTFLTFFFRGGGGIFLIFSEHFVTLPFSFSYLLDS